MNRSSSISDGGRDTGRPSSDPSRSRRTSSRRNRFASSMGFTFVTKSARGKPSKSVRAFTRTYLCPLLRPKCCQLPIHPRERGVENNELLSGRTEGFHGEARVYPNYVKSAGGIPRLLRGGP